MDDADTEEQLIYAGIKAATAAAESYTRRAFVTQTWDLKLSGWWHRSLIVPKPPLQSVTSITYTDENGTSQTWASSNYIVTTPSGDFAERGEISRADDVTFPTLDDIQYPVTVRFVAGYGDGDDVPEGIKFGIRKYVADLYENRQSFVVGTISQDLPQTYRHLLDSYRSLEAA